MALNPGKDAFFFQSNETTLNADILSCILKD